MFPGMDSLLTIVFLVVVWVVLMRFVLPKFGIHG
jgi:hypothetical protein